MRRDIKLEILCLLSPSVPARYLDLMFDTGIKTIDAIEGYLEDIVAEYDIQLTIRRNAVVIDEGSWSPVQVICEEYLRQQSMAEAA